MSGYHKITAIKREQNNCSLIFWIFLLTNATRCGIIPLSERKTMQTGLYEVLDKRTNKTFVVRIVKDVYGKYYAHLPKVFITYKLHRFTNWRKL